MLLIGFIEALLKGDLKGAPIQKVVHIVVIKERDVLIHTMHSHRIITDTLDSLHQAMVMVEATIVLLVVVTGNTLIPTVVVMIVITVVVVTVVPQMICMEQVQNTHCLLSQKDNENKTDKSNMQYQISFNKA